MIFCFDVDGPLIDVSERYYRAYLSSLDGYDVNREKILDKKTFWELKQNRVSDLELGILSGLSFKEAKTSTDLRKSLTFKSEYFKYDEIFNDVIKTFEQLKSKKIFFFLVTLRGKEQLNLAVKQFKLNKFLKDEQLFSFSDDLNAQNEIHAKYLMIYKAISRFSLNPLDIYVVGDTDVDIHAGRLAMCKKIISIPRGLRSKEQLKMLKPDYMIEKLHQILELKE